MPHPLCTMLRWEGIPRLALAKADCGSTSAAACSTTPSSNEEAELVKFRDYICGGLLELWDSQHSRV